jgi:enterochelin esterase family protein
MKRTLILAAALLAGATALAQQALGPASGIISPEINPDHTVTFRYRGPKAVTVQLTGDFLPARKIEYERDGQKQVYEAAGVVDLKEGPGGMWTYTSEPLTGELYSYSFLVDGVRTMDPNNIYQNRDIATWTNIFILSAEPGDKGWYYEVHDTPHGNVAHVWYDSPALGATRRMSVYTPAGYERGKQKYPVLYLLHGSGGDEDAWLDLGRTAQILDNLIAEGKAEPMIVVMPNGVFYNRAAPGAAVNMFQPTMTNSRSDSTVEIEDSFPDIIKYVESNYRVKKGGDYRAVAGLSMGGRQSSRLSRRYPGTFGYVGQFSGVAIPDGDNDPELAAQFAAKPKLFWIGVGKDDGVKRNSLILKDYCDTHGYPCEYYESDGGHIWRNWRVYLTIFAQKIFK